MKKFFSPVLMTALTLCLTIQASHGMDPHEMEIEQTNHTRFLEGIRVAYPEIISHYDSDPKIKQAQINKLRLVNHTFKKIVDSHTTELDLSAFFWAPWEKRPRNDEIFNDSYNNRFKYCEGQLFLWQETDVNFSCHTKHVWSLCKPMDGKTIWTSRDIYDADIGMLNPLLTFFRDISMDLTDFTHLISLNLTDNAAIQDKDLSYLTNLRKLDLTNNKSITDKSVCCLTNLEELDLSSDKKHEELEPQVKLSALHPLKHLKILTLDTHRKDTGEYINFLGLRELRFSGANLLDIYQQVIHIADAQFLHIEINKDQSNHPNFSILKENYKKTIFLLTSLCSNLTSKLLEESYSLAKKDMRKYTALVQSQGKSGYRDLGPEYEAKLKIMIKGLLKISNTELKIVHASGHDRYSDMLDL